MQAHFNRLLEILRTEYGAEIERSGRSLEGDLVKTPYVNFANCMLIIRKFTQTIRPSEEP